ncbi:MAG: metallophosphoesterase [Pseudomonadota bacterium]
MVAKPFTFALITDTHIRPPQGDDSSPYAVNDLANGRARYACDLLAAQEPEFTVHLGDMVHTLPHLPTYQAACDEAHRIFDPLKPELHFVPGNHDIGDKPMAASPAGAVDDYTMSAYHTQFGPSWHCFENQGCLFVVINSSLINSQTEMEKEQRFWLETTLSRHTNKRTFIFSHYPPFINQPSEPSHYDNYAEPGRSWLLDLIEKHAVEAVISGHVHQFFYNRLGRTKFYCLPPTSFTRQDYAELYRTICEDEFGRDDIGKFAVALVHVTDEGHEVEFLPTNGMVAGSGNAVIRREVRMNHDNICVHLRNAWYEAVDLPYNGPMEEFSRKRARNDYPLMRLWQMGISDVRTPLDDLLDPTTRQRIEDWSRAGVGFTFVSSEKPDTLTWEIIHEHAHLVSTLEFAARLKDVPSLLNALKGAKVGDLKVSLTKIHTSADEKAKGTNFAHNVSSGFLPSEVDEVASLLDDAHPVSSVVYQVNLDEDIVAIVTKLANRHVGGLVPVFNIRFAQRNPAAANFDDENIAQRVRQVLDLRACLGGKKTEFQFDTFMDIDRGYSPRHGLLDRSSNFRRAGLVLRGSN